MTDPAEDIEVPPPAPKPKRRAKHRRTAQKVVAFQAPEEFEGMTALECCTACRKDCCIISETNICAHPHKGAQLHDNASPKVIARQQRAAKVLKHQKIDRQTW